jgi:hypothetical protein
LQATDDNEEENNIGNLNPQEGGQRFLVPLTFQVPYEPPPTTTATVLAPTATTTDEQVGQVKEQENNNENTNIPDDEEYDSREEQIQAPTEPTVHLTRSGRPICQTQSLRESSLLSQLKNQ